MDNFDYILAKHEDDEIVPLTKHLLDVSSAAVVIAKNVGMNVNIAKKGALLHDIGKVSPVFQATLKQGYVRSPGFIFRHEIASLFFLLINKDKLEKAKFMRYNI